MRKPKYVFFPLISAFALTFSSPGYAQPNAGGANCIGLGASYTMGAGILEALAFLRGMLFGTEIAATHCDPSFE